MSLQNANIEMGINKVSNISETIKIDKKLDIKYKTVMGVDIPITAYSSNKVPDLTFGLLDTTISIDEAITSFQNIKTTLIELARLETTISRLDDAIIKVQKRSNSLKDIIIPNYLKNQKSIQDILDERDREEFTRMKLIKQNK